MNCEGVIVLLNLLLSVIFQILLATYPLSLIQDGLLPLSLQAYQPQFRPVKLILL